MSLQALVDGMNAQWMRERAESQMTLGGLISSLESMQEGAMVANIGNPQSYRGYYSDLAFERADGLRPAKDLLSDCRAAMGKVFVGYKGGDFVMGELTPVWIAEYGCCGVKIMEIREGGEVDTAEDD